MRIKCDLQLAKVEFELENEIEAQKLQLHLIGSLLVKTEVASLRDLISVCNISSTANKVTLTLSSNTNSYYLYSLPGIIQVALNEEGAEVRSSLNKDNKLPPDFNNKLENEYLNGLASLVIQHSSEKVQFEIDVSGYEKHMLGKFEKLLLDLLEQKLPDPSLVKRLSDHLIVIPNAAHKALQDKILTAQLKRKYGEEGEKCVVSCQSMFREARAQKRNKLLKQEVKTAIDKNKFSLANTFLQELIQRPIPKVQIKQSTVEKYLNNLRRMEL